MVNEEAGTVAIGDVGADAQVVPARGVAVTNAKVEPMSAELARVASEFFGPDGRHESDYTFYYSHMRVDICRPAHQVHQQPHEMVINNLHACRDDNRSKHYVLRAR
ncbi:MAG: hypothetical protein II832_09740 [Synergistaceae bacterium]|nr:hypothetical protein [Synergistaceae bacterium]